MKIPFTLILIGHNQEILKEVTQTNKLEESGMSAICRFDFKSILGDLKEEDVKYVTVKIEMNNQKLEVGNSIFWLRIATTCLERQLEAVKQNNAKKHPKESSTYFTWVSNNNKPSKIQTAEAAQDQFNFGSGAYVCDPEVFEFEENIDIGQQLSDSINNPKGYMHKIFQKALKQKGKPMEFKWLKKDKDKSIRFGGDPFENIKTKAWPFGRTSAILKKGKITVCDDGRYFVEGILEFRDDNYSWKEDATSDGSIKGDILKDIHNEGIHILGQNYNGKDLGDWGGTVTPSIEDNINKLPRNKNSVEWNKASKHYINSKDKGTMPVKYSKKYHFYTFGISH
jgi:hypothetical protein